MLKIIISGANGHMGQTVARIAQADSGIKVVAGIDPITAGQNPFPVYSSPHEFEGEADAVIDFSNPLALTSLLGFCMSRLMPLVLCTTGHTTEQLEQISSASKAFPIFRTGNLSLGINLITDLIRRACAVLGDGYDIEVVERHHRRKVDAPSGTAVMLAEAAASSLPYEAEFVYERESRREARSRQEIGISSVRGGTIVGEHEVIFAGLDEVIEIKHTAASRDVFAVGAVRAARFMASVTKPGLYTMRDVLA